MSDNQEPTYEIVQAAYEAFRKDERAGLRRVSAVFYRIFVMGWRAGKGESNEQ